MKAKFLRTLCSTAFFFLMLLDIAGCGQTGPLTLPEFHPYHDGSL